MSGYPWNAGGSFGGSGLGPHEVTSSGDYETYSDEQRVSGAGLGAPDFASIGNVIGSWRDTRENSITVLEASGGYCYCSEEEEERSCLGLDTERSQLVPAGATEPYSATFSPACDSPGTGSLFDPGLTKKGGPRKVKQWQIHEQSNDPEEKSKTEGAKKQRDRRTKQKGALEALKNECSELETVNKLAVEKTRALHYKIKDFKEKESDLQKDIQKQNKSLQRLKAEMDIYKIKLGTLVEVMDPESRERSCLKALYEEMAKEHGGGSGPGCSSDF